MSWAEGVRVGLTAGTSLVVVLLAVVIGMSGRPARRCAAADGSRARAGLCCAAAPGWLLMFWLFLMKNPLFREIFGLEPPKAAAQPKAAPSPRATQPPWVAVPRLSRPAASTPPASASSPLAK